MAVGHCGLGDHNDRRKGLEEGHSPLQDINNLFPSPMKKEATKTLDFQNYAYICALLFPNKENNATKSNR